SDQLSQPSVPVAICDRRSLKTPPLPSPKRVNYLSQKANLNWLCGRGFKRKRFLEISRRSQRCACQPELYADIHRVRHVSRTTFLLASFSLSALASSLAPPSL